MDILSPIGRSRNARLSSVAQPGKWRVVQQGGRSGGGLVAYSVGDRSVIRLGLSTVRHVRLLQSFVRTVVGRFLFHVVAFRFPKMPDAFARCLVGSRSSRVRLHKMGGVRVRALPLGTYCTLGTGGPIRD